jgi:hypothetical protein
MKIRRPVVVLLAALTLTGGGALTACNAPPDAPSGTPADKVTIPSARTPEINQYDDNLPNLSDQRGPGG